MEIHTLDDMFVYELQGAYHMELRLVDILDEMATNATNDRISAGFEDHRDDTKEHVERLRKVFHALDRPPEERDCQLVEALDQERQTFEDSVHDDDLLNLFYLGAGIKTERIELTTYDSLLTAADRLDYGREITDPLEANKRNEDRTLSKLQALTKASELKSLWEKLTP